MPQEPAAPLPAQETYPKESLWPTIGVIVLLIMILALGMGLFIFYMSNSALTQENTALRTQNQTLNADKESLATQVQDLAKQIAQLNCDGVWNGESCAPYPVTITTKNASGTSPVTAAFVIQAKHSKYTIDYGDGTSGAISDGAKLSTAGECTPKDNGLCLFNLTHKYQVTSQSDTYFEIRISSGTTVVATTSVTVVAKK